MSVSRCVHVLTAVAVTRACEHVSPSRQSRQRRHGTAAYRAEAAATPLPRQWCSQRVASACSRRPGLAATCARALRLLGDGGPRRLAAAAALAVARRWAMAPRCVEAVPEPDPHRSRLTSCLRWTLSSHTLILNLTPRLDRLTGRRLALPRSLPPLCASPARY